MSRSRRKTPICGWCKADSDKWYKQKAHRKERKLINNQLNHITLTDYPSKLLTYNRKEFGDNYLAPKDGKLTFFNDNDKEYEHLMRK